MDVATRSAIEALEASDRFPAHEVHRVVDEALGRLAERGLSFRIRDDMDAFSDFVAAQAAKGTWFALVPPLDAKASRLTPHNSLWAEISDAAGEVVGTQAVRTYDWRGTDLAQEAAALRMLYRDPATQARPGERWAIGGSAPLISGTVVYSGAAWYRPDHRRAGMLHAVARLVRAVVHARWDVDFIFSFMARETLERGVARSVGYPHAEWVVEKENALHQAFDVALIWMDRPAIHADFSAYVARLDAARSLPAPA